MPGGNVHSALAIVVTLLTIISLASGLPQRQPNLERSSRGAMRAKTKVGSNHDVIDAIAHQHSSKCTLENAMILQGLDADGTKALFDRLFEQKSWFCSSNLDGSNTFFGIPQASQSLEFQKEVFKTSSPYAQSSIASLQKGLPCVFMTTKKVREMNQVYLNVLNKIQTRVKAAKMEKHMESVISNKANTLTEDGRTQIGNAEKTCWDDVYVPLYTAFVLSSMNEKAAVTSHEDVYSMLGISTKMHEYTLRTKTLTPSELRARSHAFLSDDAAVTRAIAKTTIPRGDSMPDSDSNPRGDSSATGDCHPICQELVEWSSVLAYTQYTSCCSMCSVNHCVLDDVTSYFLTVSTSSSMSKDPPYEIEIVDIDA